MATYDLNRSELSNYLNGAVSSATKSGIFNALKAAGTLPTDKLSITVDELSGNATATEAKKVSLVVDSGKGTLNVSSVGHVVVGGADGALRINLQGGPGDTVIAGNGNTVIARSGDNKILGTSGNATLFAGSGADTIIGGDGTGNAIYGGLTGSHAALYAGTGNATVTGGRSLDAHDTLYGSSSALGPDNQQGNAKLQVSMGNNVLRAGAGNDTLFGGSGHDTLYGGANTLMYAGSGGSTLISGIASGIHETMKGGAGAGTFQVNRAANSVEFVNGGAGNDTLNLSATSKEAHVSAQNENGVTTIRFSGNNQTVQVSGVETINFSDKHTIDLSPKS